MSKTRKLFQKNKVLLQLTQKLAIRSKANSRRSSK